MPTGPAARITDNVMHPLPPVLTPGPGSVNVLIGFLPAWRGLPLAAVGALQAAKNISETTIKVAEGATLAAAGTPGAPAAKAAEEATKAAAAAAMGSLISSMAGMADIHVCATPLPIPPHGPGLVIDGSPTVMINNLPACRLGDTVLEAIGPPNKIMKGEFTVIIGQSGGGGGGGGMGGGMPGGGGSSAPSAPTAPASPQGAGGAGVVQQLAGEGAGAGGGTAPAGGGPAGAGAGGGAGTAPGGGGPSPAVSPKPRALANKKVSDTDEKPQEGSTAAPAAAGQTPSRRKVSREQALENALADAARLGIAILTDDDPEIKAYMDDAARREGIPPEHMHAVTLGSETIVIRKEHASNVRVLREELIHAQQQMGDVAVGAGQDMITAMELDARRKLLENVDDWALTDDEVVEIAQEIATIEKRGKY